MTNTGSDPYQFTVSCLNTIHLKGPINSIMANKVENTAGLLDHQPKILVEEGRPLVLESGLSIAPVPVAYQTYGRLNDDKSNAILVCHALTGDQYVAGKHPITGRLGWWNHLVGPGLTLDTDNYFIICVNVLGGCMGSYGPATIDSNTGEQYGLGFPVAVSYTHLTLPTTPYV